jgi:hypothetical protein
VARRLARAQEIADTSSASSLPVQPEATTSENTSLRSGIEKAAQLERVKKFCLCHKEQHRPHESRGCCRAQIDSIRWTGRVAADTDEDDVARVQDIIDSGVVPRAKKKSELLAQREGRGTASALKEVANATNKPVVVVTKQELPESVSFVDPVQARHVGKSILLRGLNFLLGVKDAYPLLTPFEASVVANAAQRSAEIQAAIEEVASQRGLGEEDRKAYVSLLWRHAVSTAPFAFQDRGNAIRILSKVFIEQQASQQQPQVLVIQGWEDGLKQMFPNGELERLQPVTTMPDISEDDFEKEDSND